MTIPPTKPDDIESAGDLAGAIHYGYVTEHDCEYGEWFDLAGATSRIERRDALIRADERARVIDAVQVVLSDPQYGVLGVELFLRIGAILPALATERDEGKGS